jgi:hypothetical protein
MIEFAQSCTGIHVVQGTLHSAQRVRLTLSCVPIWAGYEHPVGQVVEDMLSCLDDPALALLQWNEAFGVVQVCGHCLFRIPAPFWIVHMPRCLLGAHALSVAVAAHAQHVEVGGHRSNFCRPWGQGSLLRT